MPQKRVKIPTPLVDLMTLTHELLASGDPEAIAGDDAIETDRGFGGLVEPGGDLLRFTYFAKEQNERWDVVVTTAQVKSIANKKLKSLPRLSERPPWELNIDPGIFVESEAEAQAKLDELESLLRRAGADKAVAAAVAGEPAGDAPADEAPAKGAISLAAILGAALDSDPGEVGDDEEVSEELLDGARQLLQLMLDAKALELSEGAKVDAVAAAIMPIIESEMRPFAKAEALSNALFDRDDVEEVYVSDEELAKLLEKW